jgi:hypothetical protein
MVKLIRNELSKIFFIESKKSHNNYNLRVYVK